MTESVFCRACGTKQEPDARFCNGCGAAVGASALPAEGPNTAGTHPIKQDGAPHQNGAYLSNKSSGNELKNKSKSRLRVSAVNKGSQADQLGIKVGDLIVSYDGVPVARDFELSSVIYAAKKKKVASATILIQREEQKLTFEASLESLGLNCEEITENIVTSQQSNIDYQTKYGVARGVSSVISFIGWVLVIVGIIVAVTPILGAKNPGFGSLSLMAVIPGLGAAVSGFLLIMGAQVTRATVDNADHTREIMNLLRSE